MSVAKKGRSISPILLIVCFASLVAPVASALEAIDFLHEFERSLEQIYDYQVRVVTWAREAGEVEKTIMDLYYSRPGTIRADVISSSRTGDEGSVALLDEEGRVTVRTGSRFFPITVRYAKDHPRVTSIRSRRIDEGMMSVVLSELSGAIASNTATVHRTPEGYEIVKAGDGGRSRETLHVDNNFRLRSHETREKGRVVEFVTWHHYASNLGLPEEMFDVKFRKLEVERLPIATLARIAVGSPERGTLSRFE